jgi:4-azaleucine resistance transporter AzlC
MIGCYSQVQHEDCSVRAIKRWVSEAGAGMRDVLPALVAAIPIGLLYGALSSGKGLSVAETALTSALVFAGGAQFAAVDLWHAPPPILILALSTLLINARHVLMGASLARKVTHYTPLQRLISFFFLADEIWALSERRAAKAELTFAYAMGMSSIFWLNWVSTSTLGALAGSLMGDPRRLGADFAFTALFIGLIAGFWKGRVTAIPIAASASVAALTYVSLGPPWHVALGAFAGIAAAYWADETATRA